ncbi:hypothetical protein CFN49_10085 [Lactiplantibacillus plantarum]|uniref:LysM peptidoglycan-binding domain-containing protein n=1 Tax=Lactiplantibacillus plantarum TaxID=1590 RepID=UPI000DC75CB5|nr:LysM peptidoglycan-binding domain-containing protein [Lactiplantibacillus plantarum]AWY48564.1 hypothetical protein CFN49_10085 [Lactiplantibacillus plantarum]
MKMKSKIFTWSALVLAGIGLATGLSSQKAQASEANTTKNNITVTAQAGDTVWGFSQKYDTSVDSIAKANSLSNPSFILIGQKLAIPTDTTSKSTREVTVIAQWGDTVWGFAQKYGSSVSAIAKANNLSNPDLIFVGQRLVIPILNNSAKTTTNTTTGSHQATVSQAPKSANQATGSTAEGSVVVKSHAKSNNTTTAQTGASHVTTTTPTKPVTPTKPATGSTGTATTGSNSTTTTTPTKPVTPTKPTTGNQGTTTTPTKPNTGNQTSQSNQTSSAPATSTSSSQAQSSSSQATSSASSASQASQSSQSSSQAQSSASQSSQSSSAPATSTSSSQAQSSSSQATSSASSASQASQSSQSSSQAQSSASQSSQASQATSSSSQTSQASQSSQASQATSSSSQASSSASQSSSQAGSSSSKPADNDKTYNASVVASDMVSQINQARAVKGRQALVYDSVLEQVGNRRAPMLVKNFAHADANGNSYAEPIAKELGIWDTYYAGEDLGLDGFDATNQKTADGIIAAVKNSPDHWSDITNASYSKIGVGLYKDSQGGLYIAIEMGF